jgi:hypothetical protein
MPRVGPGIETGKSDIYLKPPARQPQVNSSIYVNPAGNAVSSRMDCPMVVKSIGS